MITRPSTLTAEEMDKLMAGLADRGARISMTDPRVTSFQTWVLSSIGLSLIGLAGWGIKSINDLNQSMTRVFTQNEYRDRQVDRVEQHAVSLDERIVILERKLR